MSDRLAQALEFLRKSGVLSQEAPSDSLDYSSLPQEERANVASALAKARSGQDLTATELFAIEAIVIPGLRPSIEIVGGDYAHVANPVWSRLNDEDVHARLKEVFRSVGRIELVGHPGAPPSGAGFVVGHDLVMTNRHVAELFAAGLGDRTLALLPGRNAAIDFGERPDDGQAPILRVHEIVMIHPFWDMALLRVDGLTDDHPPLALHVDGEDGFVGRDVVVVGYPAFDWRNAPDVQDRVFNRKVNVKRMMPGKGLGRRTVGSYGNQGSAFATDASTLGASSGSAVIDPATGHVLGLQFSSNYLDANMVVPAWEMARDHRIVGAGVNFAAPVRPDVKVAHDWWKILAGGAALALGGAAIVAATSAAAQAAPSDHGTDTAADNASADHTTQDKASADTRGGMTFGKAALSALGGAPLDEAALDALGDTSIGKVARAAWSENGAVGKAAREALGDGSLGQAALDALGDDPLGKVARAAFGGSSEKGAQDKAGDGAVGQAFAALGVPAIGQGTPSPVDAAADAAKAVTIPLQINLRLNVVTQAGPGQPGPAGPANLLTPLGGGDGAVAAQANEIPIVFNFKFEHELNHSGEVNHTGEVNHSANPLSLAGGKVPGSRRLLSDIGGGALGGGMGAGVGTSIGSVFSALHLGGGAKDSASASSPSTSTPSSVDSAPTSSVAQADPGGSGPPAGPLADPAGPLSDPDGGYHDRPPNSHGHSHGTHHQLALSSDAPNPTVSTSDPNGPAYSTDGWPFSYPTDNVPNPFGAYDLAWEKWPGFGAPGTAQTHDANPTQPNGADPAQTGAPNGPDTNGPVTSTPMNFGDGGSPLVTLPQIFLPGGTPGHGPGGFPVSLPEPSVWTMLLIAFGMLGGVAYTRKRRRRSRAAVALGTSQAAGG